MKRLKNWQDSNKNKAVLIALLLGFLFYPKLSVFAVTSYEDNPNFNPDILISDEDISDYNSMTVEEIRDFVKTKGGTLGEYVDSDLKMPAYYIIWLAAQDYQINPKFLLTLLQKEQSLVTDDEPSDNQYNWATGFSCYGGICLDVYKGFAKQVLASARKFRSYLDDLEILSKHQDNYYCTFTKWCIGLPKTSQDQIVIVPKNKATAALYTYNPYRGNTVVDGLKIGANYNFWKIWNNWFVFEVFRPNGTLVKAENSKTVYLIKDGQKLPFSSISVLASRYDPKNIVVIDEKELNQYPQGPEIKFAQYSLLMNERKDIFMLADDKLRHIVSMEVFRTLGFNPEEIIEVSNEETDQMTKGEDLTLQSSYPTGALIRDTVTNGVYFVQNGIKYPIASPEILKSNFPGQKVVKGLTEELDKYPKGDFVKFKDGTLIKAKDDNKVYVISEGKKYHIQDEASFTSRGYRWDNIIETNQQSLDIHQTVQTLTALSTSTVPYDIVSDQENQLEQINQ